MKHFRYANVKKPIFVAVLLVTFLAIFLYYSLIKSTKIKPNLDEAKTTSKASTAQESFSSGNEREPGNSVKENQGSGTVTDNNGAIVKTAPESSWSRSTTGEISVYTPVANELVKTGTSIGGESSLPKVSFRIIDDVTGVISTGSISVVAGKFSGTINFKTSGTKGRVDIFGTKQDGVEFGNVEIPIRFK